MKKTNPAESGDQTCCCGRSNTKVILLLLMSIFGFVMSVLLANGWLFYGA
tara:strand:+ start:208 stop:357 length:150 start_codon:yes stop_codon:yes gene_type:complete